MQTTRTTDRSAMTAVLAIALLSPVAIAEREHDRVMPSSEEPVVVWRHIYMTVVDAQRETMTDVTVGGIGPSGMEGKADLMDDGLTWHMACPDPKLIVEVDCNGTCSATELIIGDHASLDVELRVIGDELSADIINVANPDDFGSDSTTAASNLPENDFCVHAICVGDGETVYGDNFLSLDLFDISSCGEFDIFDVWYFYEHPGGTSTFDTCGSDLDTVLSLWDSCDPFVFNELACNDDTPNDCQNGSSTDSYVEYSGAPGLVYIRVSGWLFTQGEFRLNVNGGEDFSPAVGGCGDCNVANGTPGCSNAGCEAIVCGFDPFCCNDTWDDTCANEAILNCEECLVCGPNAGPCDSPNGTPGCDDPDCCAAVCGADPFCCDNTWDQLCSDQVPALCDGIGCPPPPNDDCINAIALDPNSTIAGNTTAAMPMSPPCIVPCDLPVTSPGIWYTVVGTGNVLEASTCSLGTGFDTKLHVYCGSCDALMCVAANDDSDDHHCFFTSEVEWCSQEGVTYYILVSGYGDATGAFQLTIEDEYEPCYTDLQCAITGACCIPPLGCMDGVTEDECTNTYFGIFQGPGSECTGVIYSQTEGDAFEDISASGTVAAMASSTDDGGDVVELPFEFSFYGQPRTEIGISSNGYMTFGGSLADYTNDAFPDVSSTNAIIAPYWDDLRPDLGGDVRYETRADPERFIVQWTNVPHWNNPEPNTFQVVLFPDDRIEMRYAVVQDNSPTAGIENETGSFGIDLTDTLPASTAINCVAHLCSACCLEDDDWFDDPCIWTGPQDCDDNGGVWIGHGVPCSPLGIGSPGGYRLGNHPDANDAPPGYGLRLDELLSPGLTHEIYSFDFEAPGTEMYLVYNGSTIHIFGIAFGGWDRGLFYDPLLSDYVFIDFTYSVGVGTAAGDDDLIVTGPDGANGGTLEFLNLGGIYSFYDYSGDFGYTFRFGDEDDDQGHRGFPGYAGWGWLVHPDPDSQYILSSDWLFTADDVCNIVSYDPPAPVDTAGPDPEPRAARPAASSTGGDVGANGRTR